MTEVTAAHIAQDLWMRIQNLDILVGFYDAEKRGIIPPSVSSSARVQAIIADAPKTRRRLLWILEDMTRARGMAEGYTIFHLDPTVHDSLRNLTWGQILPDWSLLKALPVARAWELVAYSANIRPELLEEKWPGPSVGTFRDWLSGCGRAFNERLKITEAAIAADALRSKHLHTEPFCNAFVAPYDFITWAGSADLSIPEGMLAAVDFGTPPLAPATMPEMNEGHAEHDKTEDPQERYNRIKATYEQEKLIKPKGALNRVAEKEGISRQRVSQILNNPELKFQ
ncbi:MAG: hypothetical protein HQM01_13300 [Magnetococcales bacterium]|nr:hypothetical protein [Magnetococcales bacterium]